MPLYYRQAQDDIFTGSPAYLESQQSAFRNDQASGLIEVQASPGEQILVLYAGGLRAGAYRVSPDARQRIPPREITAGWEGPEASIRTVRLPDTAGRALWLALESRTSETREIPDTATLNQLLEANSRERRTALMEINSAQCDGFLYLRNGAVLPAETIFSTPRGFLTSLTETQPYLTNPMTVRLLDPETSSVPYQCAMLRMSIASWGRGILSRYRELVGQKLLEALSGRLNSMIIPWQWRIQVVNTEIIDQHFFHNVETAAQAYRSLLISMSEQIVEVIGNMLARRLLADAYSQLEAEEIMTLEARILSPAVFA